MTNKQLQQTSTEQEKPFDPTNNMIKWLDTAFELGYTASISSVAEKSGVDRTTWYVWRNDPKFVEWWDAQWEKHIRLNRWKLDAMGMKQAERNFDYWRTMMERTGLIEPPQKGGTAVQVNNYAPKDLHDNQLNDIIS